MIPEAMEPIWAEVDQRGGGDGAQMCKKSKLLVRTDSVVVKVVQ